jgi:glycosyltransferase A (GT-A) superfamily protein (DUF2064 family)
MDLYDADLSPDPIAWLAIDELSRIELILDYHRRHDVRTAAPRIHAAIHAVVENQVAMTSPAVVAETLQRLQQEGLSRHDAIHAIGELVTARLAAAVKSETVESAAALNAKYEADLRQLTAEGWRQR